VAAAIPDGVVRVGVFAGASTEAMHAMADAVGLDAIQLHGELWLSGSAEGLLAVPTDPPQRCGELRPLPVIRAVHLEAAGGPEPNRLAEANRWVEAARQAGAAPAMLLVDAVVTRETAAAARGGTGRTVDWAGLASSQADIPLALAGGLKPENVAEAIAVSGAAAVDVASGVEREPGVKDHDKLRRFLGEAQATLPKTS
jgi:phosphoribosylanthranilate isomerase